MRYLIATILIPFALLAQVQNIPNTTFPAVRSMMNGNFGWLNTNKAGNSACPANQYAIQTTTAGVVCASLTSGQLTTALGFTPENPANKGQNGGYLGIASDGSVAIGTTVLPSYTGLNNASLFIGTTGGAAGNATVTGVENHCIGHLCGAALTTGYNNHGFGWRALPNVTTGYYNVAMGHDAGYAITTGSGNTCIGEGTCFGNGVPTASVAGNTAIGDGAFLNGTNNNNTAVGVNAGTALTTGFSDTIIGAYACDTATTASENICIGYQAGHNTNTTGWHITLLGVQSAPAGTGDSNETVIGFGATGAGSNSVTIGDANVTKMCFGGTSTCWYKGAGVPSVNCGVGSLYSNTSGGASTTLYVCTATNTWTAK